MAQRRVAKQIRKPHLLAVLAEMPVDAAVKKTPTGVPKAPAQIWEDAQADEGKIVDPCWRALTTK
jgi:hypothetical protein